MEDFPGRQDDARTARGGIAAWFVPGRSAGQMGRRVRVGFDSELRHNDIVKDERPLSLGTCVSK